MEDQHDCKNDSKTSKKRSVVASSKVGAARGNNNKEKLVGLGNQLEKSQQSNPTHVSKSQPASATKRKFQKTAATAPRVPSVYNLRNRDQITEGAKDPPGYNLRSKVQKTEGQNVSTVIQKRKPPKNEGSKDSLIAIQKKGTPKSELPITHFPESSELPIKKIGTTKSLATSLVDLDKKNQPLTSQYEPYFCDPVYHIRWEGDDMENRPFGQNCILCNKDLSGATEDDDSEYNDDFQYEDNGDDDDDDDEYGYYDDIMPPLLPAVDILPCGHAYHTECLQTEEQSQSSDPKCVLCSKMA